MSQRRRELTDTITGLNKLMSELDTIFDRKKIQFFSLETEINTINHTMAYLKLTHQYASKELQQCIKEEEE